MKKLYVSTFALFFAATGFSQSAFWSENFGTGCSRGQTPTAFASINGNWTEATTGTNDTHADMWFVSATASGTGGGNCSDNCIVNTTTDRSLHIGNAAVVIPNVVSIGADTGSTYLTGAFCGFNICSTTNKRVMSPIINCLGKTNIVAAFVYYENGEGTGDDATMVYSPDGGATWTMIDALAKTTLGPCQLPGATWFEYSVNLPASANNNGNVKIGFTWTNDNDSQGSDPSFAVDDIALLEAPQGMNEIAAQLVNIYVAPNNELVIDSKGKAFTFNAVTDITGRTVSAVLQQDRLQLGVVSPGIYFVTLEINSTRITKKVLLGN
ncbi:MAG: hypothetical protein FD123_438 [Bacteroidetes bacterium]|nr:MAG: hypothetical protein FD123_438 [Bacteroidota bacterium]